MKGTAKIYKPFEFFLSVHAELYSLAKFSEDDEVEDERAGKQRVLTRVVDHNGIATSHQNLAGVLVHCTLAVAHVRHVLYYDAVIWVLAWRVQQWI